MALDSGPGVDSSSAASRCMIGHTCLGVLVLRSPHLLSGGRDSTQLKGSSCGGREVMAGEGSVHCLDGGQGRLVLEALVIGSVVSQWQTTGEHPSHGHFESFVVAKTSPCLPPLGGVLKM